MGFINKSLVKNKMKVTWFLAVVSLCNLAWAAPIIGRIVIGRLPFIRGSSLGGNVADDRVQELNLHALQNLQDNLESIEMIYKLAGRSTQVEQQKRIRIHLIHRG